tara:strand:- start:66358 stop:66810 length:453 start_codon:yes stop_codon:yes gene_type:complete
MYIIKRTFLIAVLTIFTLSCEHSKQTENQQITTETEEIHHSDDSVLKLNDGAKWQANPETTEGVRAMQMHLEEFKRTGQNDYRVLKQKLEQEFQYIFEKCTMKGESHDQLHNFLYPMKEMFAGLEKDEETARKSLILLEQHLPVYFQYFE